MLNPRSYVKEELWKQAPVFTGSTCFEPLEDAKNILVTGGAGFMYVVASRPLQVATCASLTFSCERKTDMDTEPAGSRAT